MSERLIIRLGRRRHQPIHWLVWSDSAGEIIASGILTSADELGSLSERAGGREVDILVAASELAITQVKLPGKNRHQALKALPFLLEEQLASDMELAHFTLGKLDGDCQPVVVVEKALMHQWLKWLQSAGLTASRMSPDVLSLPLHSDSYSLLQLGEQVLIRQGRYRGMTVDQQWLAPVLQSLSAEHQASLSIADYGHHLEAEPEGIDWLPQPLELPLQVLATGGDRGGVNLLHGEFSQRKASRNRGLLWRNVVILGLVSLVLILSQRWIQIQQLESQQARLKQSSEDIFRQLFPNKKRVIRLKSQIRNHLKQLSDERAGVDLLSMLNLLRDAFIKVPQLKPVTLKFDGKRQEIRIQADADNFQQFEQFKSHVEKHFNVQTGTMNNQNGRVNGSLTIRVVS